MAPLSPLEMHLREREVVSTWSGGRSVAGPLLRYIQNEWETITQAQADQTLRFGCRDIATAAEAAGVRKSDNTAYSADEVRHCLWRARHKFRRRQPALRPIAMMPAVKAVSSDETRGPLIDPMPRPRCWGDGE